MNIDDAKKLGIELMESSKATYLTTINSDGFPITRAVFNLRNKEQFPELTTFFDNLVNKFEVYISTNTSSVKIKHIKENPKICLYFCDPEDIKGIMFSGEAEIITDMKVKKDLWLDNWVKYYSEGLEDPDFTLLRLRPKLAEVYYRLRKIQFNPGE